jgi:hypothetical protein
VSGAAGNLNKNIKPKDVVIGTELIDVDLGRLTANGPVISKKLMNNLYFNQKTYSHGLQQQTEVLQVILVLADWAAYS